MDIQGLGYVGIRAKSLEDWTSFGTQFLGMQLVERSGKSLALRMDDRKQRIVIDRALGNGARFFGWEVADAAALDALAAKLETAGVTVTPEPSALSDARRVRGLISFHDPAGNRLEAFYGAEIDDTPFKPGRNISGFRTGPLGLGHAVLTVESIAPVMAFYTNVLGFRLSDYITKPFNAEELREILERVAGGQRATTVATTAAANATICQVMVSPLKSAASAKVTKGCSNWTCETRAMPPIARPAFQAKKPIHCENSAT